MASWSTRRKTLYTTGVVGVLVMLAAIPVYLFFSKPPSCTDGKQNGTEIGIDCGGGCIAACESEVNNPIIHWARPFRVAEGVYDAVAYVENPNVGIGTQEAIYKFKLYDENNVLVLEKFGKTFLLPNEQVAVFEGGLRTGERVPKRAFFELAPGISWEHITLSPEQDINLLVRDQRLENLDSRPRLRAVVRNASALGAEGIEVTAVLYDTDDNALGASRTIVESLPSGEQTSVSFTWPEPFARTPVRVEIIPRINFFTQVP